jgi:hypothetical protein
MLISNQVRCYVIRRHNELLDVLKFWVSFALLFVLDMQSLLSAAKWKGKARCKYEETYTYQVLFAVYKVSSQSQLHSMDCLFKGIETELHEVIRVSCLVSEANYHMYDETPTTTARSKLARPAHSACIIATIPSKLSTLVIVLWDAHNRKTSTQHSQAHHHYSELPFFFFWEPARAPRVIVLSERRQQRHLQEEIQA